MNDFSKGYNLEKLVVISCLHAKEIAVVWWPMSINNYFPVKSNFFLKKRLVLLFDVPIVASSFENDISLNRAFERIQRVDAKEKDKAPVSEAGRKCLGSRS